MRAPATSPPDVPIGTELLRLALPAILTGLLGTAVFLADRLMLARYDEAALASMQVQGPLLWSITSVFMASCVGTVALVARSEQRERNNADGAGVVTASDPVWDVGTATTLPDRTLSRRPRGDPGAWTPAPGRPGPE